MSPEERQEDREGPAAENGAPVPLDQSPVDQSTSDQGPVDQSPRGLWKALRPLIVFLAVAAVGIALARLEFVGKFLDTEKLRSLVRDLGAWGPLAIVALGIATPLIFLPRWPIAFVCGFLYGIVWGSLLATAASTGGAALHFVISEKLLGPLTDRLRKKYRIGRFRIDREKEFLAIFLLRAFPLSSFVATNLLAGALRFGWRRYVAASFLGMIPSSVLYASWGKLLQKPSSEFYWIAAGSLILIVLGTVYGRKLLASWMRPPPPPSGPSAP